MYKGKILKFSDQYAIICSDSLAYQKIKLKPQMSIGQTIYYFEEDIITPAHASQTSDSKWFSPTSFAFKLAPILAVLLIAVIVFNHQQISPTPIPAYGVVSIDINPSISLLVNDDGIVEHADGKNTDGQRLLSTIDIVNAPLQAAIESIISASEVQGYLNKNHQIFIATTEETENHIVSNLVENILESSELDDPYTVYVAEVNYATYEDAEEENVTIGHYLMDSVTDVPDSQLFDDTIIDKIVKENNKPIIKREAKEEKQEFQEQKKDSNTDKQIEKKDAQEQKKDSNTDKQIEKKDAQEQKKDSNANKQIEKKDAQEQKKDSNANKQIEKKDAQEQKKDANANKQSNKKDNNSNKNKDKAD